MSGFFLFSFFFFLGKKGIEKHHHHHHRYIYISSQTYAMKKKKNGTTTSTTTNSSGGVEKEDVLVSSFRLCAILLAFRASSAVHNLVHDCDETFQSLEPVHFLLCDVGTQSWEAEREIRAEVVRVRGTRVDWFSSGGAFGCEGEDGGRVLCDGICVGDIFSQRRRF